MPVMVSKIIKYYLEAESACGARVSGAYKGVSLPFSFLYVLTITKQQHLE